jgi:hypothetical protein
MTKGPRGALRSPAFDLSVLQGTAAAQTAAHAVVPATWDLCWLCRLERQDVSEIL